jgi:trimethylamine--corrinoid protein Co-methyltransferase
MITGEYWKMHDDATIKKIDQAAVRLLTRSGARIEHDGLLDLLEGAGCRIERGAHRCYFTEKLIREAVARLGGQASLAVAQPTGWNPQWQLHLGGSYPHLLEWPSGRRRLATRQDVVDLAKLGHALDEFAGVSKPVSTAEVDPRIEPLWATLAIAKITDKPQGSGEIFYPEYIEPLVRMGEVLSGKKGDTSLLADGDFFTAPLNLDPAQAACFMEKRRFGVRTTPGTMPISGMSGPVTIAGTVTIAVAELLAGWVLGYVVNPELPAFGYVCTGSMDMRTLTACFGSPEALLQDVSVVNLCRRLYGINVWAVVFYTDCKRPGLESVFLKMFGLMGQALGTDRTLWADGLLSAGQDYSPVQHLLEADMAKSIERFWGHYEVTDETVAVELIENMIKSGATNFLETDHTLDHYKAEQWYPRWLDRTAWQGTEYETQAEQKMLERINQTIKGAIANYQPPDLDRSKIAELKKIFLSAEKACLGSNVTPV